MALASVSDIAQTVTGVPAYVAGRYLLVGAQPLEVYRQLIDTAQAEESQAVPEST